VKVADTNGDKSRKGEGCHGEV